MQTNARVTLRELEPDHTQRKQRGYRWLVESRIDGKRRRKFFRHGEKEKAESHEKELKRQALAISESNRALLNEELLTEATEAFKKLQPHGTSIRDAVDFYLTHLESKAKEEKTLIAHASADYLKSMELRTLDPKTIRRARQTLNRFNSEFKNRTLSSLEGSEIQIWWETFGGIVNQRANRTDINTFLNWCVKSPRLPGFTSNPTPPAPDVPKNRDAKIVLTPSQVRRLLKKANQEMLPLIVAQVFIGVRKEESLRLRWDHFDWEEKTLSLPAEIAKGASGHARINDIPKNALKWLEPYTTNETGPILKSIRTLSSYDKALKNLRENAGWDSENKWPRNALRRTFISYHYATYSNVGLTAAMSGTSESMIFRNYRAVIKKSLAKKLWDIVP